MAEQVQLPSDIELSKVDLTTGDGKIVDITDLIHEISIYEAIGQTAVYGSMFIVDGTNVLSQANISGQEIVTFTFSKFDTDDEHIFHVMKIEQVSIVNETVSQYTLTFIDREYVLDSMSLVSQAYEGTIDSIMKDIHLNAFETEIEEADACTGTYRFVIPNWKPLQTLEWLSRKAVDSNGVPLVYLKTFRRGPKLLSFETMTADDNIVCEYFINMSTDPQASVSSNQYDYQNIARKIINFRTLQHGNALDQIRDGTYAQTYINVDTQGKTAIVKDFSGEDVFTNNPRLNEYLPVSMKAKYGPQDQKITELSRSKQSISYHQGSNFGNAFLNYNSETHDIDTIRQNYNGMLGTYMYEITVPGRFDLEPGRLVNITFPSNRLQNEKEPEANIDNKRSGKHLILACHHHFKKDSYHCILEVASDGFGEEYES